MLLKCYYYIINARAFGDFCQNKEKMMKKTAAIISACMLTFALSACSGSNYVMHTNDGRTIVSDGKPQTDNDTGMISYKDANGNKQQINRTDVKEMVELDQ